MKFFYPTLTNRTFFIIYIYIGHFCNRTFLSLFSFFYWVKDDKKCVGMKPYTLKATKKEMDTPTRSLVGRETQTQGKKSCWPKFLTTRPFAVLIDISPYLLYSTFINMFVHE